MPNEQEKTAGSDVPAGDGGGGTFEGHVQALQDAHLSTAGAVVHARSMKDMVDREEAEMRRGLKEATVFDEALQRVRSQIERVRQASRAVLRAVERADTRNAALARFEWRIGQMALAQIPVHAEVDRRLRRFEAVRQSHRGEETRSHVELGKILHALERNLAMVHEAGDVPVLSVRSEEGEEGILAATMELAEGFGCRLERADVEEYLFGEVSVSGEAGSRLEKALCETDEGQRVLDALRDYKEQFHPERTAPGVSPFHAGFRLLEAARGEEISLPSGSGGVIETLCREQRGKTVRLVMNTGTSVVLFIDDKGELQLLGGHSPYPDISPLEALQKEGNLNQVDVPISSPVRAFGYNTREFLRTMEELPEGATVSLRVRTSTGELQDVTLRRHQGGWEYVGQPPEGVPDAAEVTKNPQALDPFFPQYEHGNLPGAPAA